MKENVFVNYEAHQNIVNNNLRDRKKDYGMFFTPECVVDFMVGLIDFEQYKNKKDIAILEPACGLAQFIFGIKRNQPDFFQQAKIFGIEINRDVIDYLDKLIIDGNIELINADYLLWQTETLFDLIIGNPPYGIPSLSDHYTIKVNNDTKQKYKNLYETWFGKYNVYGAFIEKSIKLLKPDGRLIFVVPATFMILDEFRKLRKFLSQNGKTSIIYLGSNAFKPEADVSSAVLDFHKSDKIASYLELSEFRDNEICIIKSDSDWNGEVIKFKTNYTQALGNTCSYQLGDIYDIRVSPRTPEIKNSSYIEKEMPIQHVFQVLKKKLDTEE